MSEAERRVEEGSKVPSNPFLQFFLIVTGSPVPARHAINEDEEEGSEAGEESPASNAAPDTGDVVIEIARFFRYYCNVAAKKRLEKCVELLAHDCASLVYRAFALRRVYVSYEEGREPALFAGELVETNRSIVRTCPSLRSSPRA